MPLRNHFSGANGIPQKRSSTFPSSYRDPQALSRTQFQSHLELLEERVQHGPHIHVTASPAGLLRRNEWFDDLPLLVAQRAAATIVANPFTILRRPHGSLHPETGERATAPSRYNHAKTRYNLSKRALSSTLRKSGGVLFPQGNAQAGKHAASSRRSASGAGIFIMSRLWSEA